LYAPYLSEKDSIVGEKFTGDKCKSMMKNDGLMRVNVYYDK
jgi:hypothetical protein